MNHSSIVLDNGCSGGSVMQIPLFVLLLCWYGLVTKARVAVSIFIGFQFSLKVKDSRQSPRRRPIYKPD